MLASVASGSALISQGVGVAPAWGQIANAHVAAAAAIALSKLADVSCWVNPTSNTSTTTATRTNVACNAEVYDGAGWHDNATNNERITPTVAGKYLAIARLVFDANGTGVRQIYLRKNTTDIGFGYATPDASNSVSLITFAVAAMNGSSDYFSLQAYQTSGGNLNYLGTSLYTMLGCVLLPGTT